MKQKAGGGVGDDSDRDDEGDDDLHDNGESGGGVLGDGEDFWEEVDDVVDTAGIKNDS